MKVYYAQVKGSDGEHTIEKTAILMSYRLAEEWVAKHFVDDAPDAESIIVEYTVIDHESQLY